MTRDLYKSLENIIGLGCERVLTSGGEKTALEGAPFIRKMFEQVPIVYYRMPPGLQDTVA